MRQSVRRLLRSPGFATLAIGMLAIGIGINAGMLALVDAFFFRPPFHVANPAAVYRLHFTALDGEEPESTDRTHYPNIARTGSCHDHAASQNGWRQRRCCGRPYRPAGRRMVFHSD